MEGLSRSRSTAGTKVTGYQTTLATLRPLPRVARPVKDGVGRTDTKMKRTFRATHNFLWLLDQRHRHRYV